MSRPISLELGSDPGDDTPVATPGQVATVGADLPTSVHWSTDDSRSR